MLIVLSLSIMYSSAPLNFWKKVHFWTSNFCLSLVLVIKLQNRISLTIQLLKPFTIVHRAILIGGFNIFYLQFSP
jgi:hypothetical protein